MDTPRAAGSGSFRTRSTAESRARGGRALPNGHVPLRRCAAAASCSRSYAPQDHRDAAVPLPEHAARAVDERDLAVLHLRIAALAAELLRPLDHEEDAAHAGVVRREAAAIRVRRQRAA